MALIKKPKLLYVSYSSMSAFRKCPRFYYWKYVRRLEKRSLNVAFIVGRIMHTGIQTLFSDPDGAEKALKKKYNFEAQQARVEYPEMSTWEEDKLKENEYLTTGMLTSYRQYFSKFISGTKHIATEKAIKYQLNKRVMVVGKIDNILLNQAKRWMFEMKHLKSLDMDRVNAIKTDPQSGLYLEAHNRQEKEKSKQLDGIIYQIIRKPSIKQKKKESKREYFVRLSEWYHDQTDGLKMHLERIKGSFISGDAVMNTVDKVSQQIIDADFQKREFFQDFSACIRDWGRCSMYELCHGDEEKEIKLYTIRKKYKVKDGVDEDVAVVVED